MRKCTVCGKGYSSTVKRSHSMQATKYRLFPNLQWMKIENGQRVKACTKCIKTRSRKLAKVAVAA